MRSLIVVLTVGVLLASGCTDESDSLSSGTEVVSTAGTETTAPAPATDPVVPTDPPTSPALGTDAPASTPPPATTAAPAPATTLPTSVLDTDPAQTQWIAGTEEGDPEVIGDGVNCLPFYEEMSAGTLIDAACGPWSSSDGVYVWVVVRDDVSNRFFAIVWKEIAPNDWVPKLRLLEPAAGTWDSVTIVAADIDSGPNQELVSGVRYAGTGGYLDVDVIDIRSGDPAVVAALPGLESATVYAEASAGLHIWLPNFAPGDPLCCPSSWSEYILASAGGSWVASAGAVEVPIEAIPQPSQF